MSDIEFRGGEVSGQPHEGKAAAADPRLLTAAKALMLDGRKNGIALTVRDPKNPWRGQALTLAEYAAHGGRCPAPSICACQPITR